MKIFEIIKFEGNNDTLVWKFPGEDFNTLSQLIVHETQEAVLFKDGKALDLFKSGKYTLHSQNIPLLRRLVNLPFNGQSPFHCEVYFINKVVSMDILWGTASPIPIQDALYKIIIPIRANGQFGVRVIDSKKILLNMVGTIDRFDQNVLKQYFKGILLTKIKDYIAKQFIEKQISFLEIHSHLKEISNGIQNDLQQEFIKYGIELVDFNVNDISVPENDSSYQQLKKALAKKAEMAVMGYDYKQERTFNVLDKAAMNEGTSSAIMGAGMGLGMGTGLGNVMGGVMGSIASDVQSLKQEDLKMEMIKCKNCGHDVPRESQFCLKCGKKMKNDEVDVLTCPKCGAHVPKAKFCLQCGYRLEQICSGCGAVLLPGAKFCLECGKKVNM